MWFFLLVSIFLLFVLYSSEAEAKRVLGRPTGLFVICFSHLLFHCPVKLLLRVLDVLLVLELLGAAVACHSWVLLYWLELVALEQAALGSLFAWGVLLVNYLVSSLLLKWLSASSLTQISIKVWFLSLHPQVVGRLRVLELLLIVVLTLSLAVLGVLTSLVGIDRRSSSISSLSVLQVDDFLSLSFSSVGHVKRWKCILLTLLLVSSTLSWVVLVEFNCQIERSQDLASDNWAWMESHLFGWRLEVDILLGCCCMG